MRHLVLGLALAAAAVAARNAGAAPVAIGDKLVPFTLKNYDGKEVNLATLQGRKALVLAFVATRCPVSNAYNDRMAALSAEYAAKGVAFIGVNANKEETPAEVAEHAKAHGLMFPILKDEGNVEADAFGAQVTPEIYLYDPTWTLRYHGRIDNDMKGVHVTSTDLRNALDALLAGQDVPVKETKAFGCSIKRVER
jgi:peroxiredoxin